MTTITICTTNGDSIAEAIIGSVASPNVLALDRVTAGKGHLLRHYFGQGLRAVSVASGDFCFQGSLRTAWENGERRWFVELRPATLDHTRAVPRVVSGQPE